MGRVLDKEVRREFSRPDGNLMLSDRSGDSSAVSFSEGTETPKPLIS